MDVLTTSAGEMLRDARTRAGLSQRRLADRAGLTQSVISA
ncbi:MAG: helix-turn-helix domain-containing protein [Egibacteraceae bacterium]